MATAKGPTSTGAALVLGGGVAGIQCSLDLAEGGYKVYLVEKSPALGGHMSQLDKTFPTNDCSMCTLAPKLVEAGRHLNIEIVTNSELTGLEGGPGDFRAKVFHHARFVDPDICTSCGECAPVCPVVVADQYNEELGERKAIYKLYPQAIPNTYAVTKKGHSPCKRACAVHTSAQGYVALIAEERFADAYRVASEPNPFPAVCGRVCTHKCETDCTRGEVEQPIAIAGLKRFVSDFAVDERAAARARRGRASPRRWPSSAPARAASRAPATWPCSATRRPSSRPSPSPAACCASASPSTACPRRRCSRTSTASWRSASSCECGKAAGADFTVDSLLKDGYKAVYLGVGLQGGRPLPIPGNDAKGVFTAVDLLRDATLEKAHRHGQERDRHRRRRRGLRRRPHGRAPGRREGHPGLHRRRRDHAGLGRRDRRGSRRVDHLHLLVHADGRGGRPRRPRRQGRVHRLHAGRGRRARLAPAGAPRQHLQRACLRHGGLRHRPGHGRRLHQGRQGRQGREEPDRDRQADPGDRPQGRVRRRRRRRPRPLDGHRGRRRRPPRRAAPSTTSCAARSSCRSTTSRWTRPSPTTRCCARPRSWPALPMPHLPGRGPQAHLGRGQHRLHRRAGRGRGQALPQLRRLLGVHGVRAGLRPGRPAARRAATASSTSRSAPWCWPPASTSTTPATRASTATAATPTSSRRSSTSACSRPRGPTIGEVKRPLQRRAPRKIAFIQCVGLARPGPRVLLERLLHVRQQAGHADHRPRARRASPTSSSWTCAPRARASTPSTSAPQSMGVNFIRSRPSSIKEDPRPTTCSSPGKTKPARCTTDRYDMVVLLGRPRAGAQGAGGGRRARRRPQPPRLLRAARVRAARTRAARASTWSARSASPRTSPTRSPRPRPRRPRSMTGLADSRGTLTVDKEYPAERDVVGEEPRVGVFVCHCGSNIAGVIDVEGVAEYALKLPGVVYANDTCTRARPTRSRSSRTWSPSTTSTASWWRAARRAPTSRSSRTPCARPASTRSCSRWPTSATRRAGCTATSRRRRPTRPRTSIRMSVARARLLEPLLQGRRAAHARRRS